MRHPTDGTLRRLVDEPDGVADADRAHVAGCPACLSGLAAARSDAALAGAALFAAEPADVHQGWQRLSRELGAAPSRVAPAAREGRWRSALRSPVIAVVGAVAILTGATAAAATDWLQIFRAERVAPIAIDQADMLKLPDLDAYGTVRIEQRANIHRVAGADAARAATGLAAPQVDELPRGVTGTPTWQVGGPVRASFTFSAQRAAQTAAAEGKPLPPPPTGLDGSQFRLTAGPGLAAVWREQRGVPALLVARVVAPTAYSNGVPFETARDYLLTVPGVPAAVASQLRTFTADGSTLPFVVKSDRQVTTPVEVNGAPATLLTTKDRAMSFVVWVSGGQISVVAGVMTGDEVLSVARGLRWER